MYERGARSARILLCGLAVAGLLGIAGCKDTTQPGSNGNAPGKSAPGGSALAAVDTLTVKGRAPKTGYTREKFGKSWVDTDHNGCGTRDDILKRDLTGKTFRAEQGGDCVVTSGTLDDPYTGQKITYTRGKSKVDIDHAVALSDAWQKGAGQWTDDKRVQFANDPTNLIAADASANRAKGDGDAATWLPPNKGYRCEYVARQVAVKKKYGVWVTAAEKDAMRKQLNTCPTQKLPTS
ncbi:HNH endonuclease family protein [Streptomyces sp. H10-C2]|uniref:HNH endonuclease family protein n=1 Tax=unclassified Streptomyces TaxID=2593676 RepID=UPI0024BB6BDB|nr:MULTISPECIES: HNH endonuclease family protein [unclassified Streptomyces]MDJ0341324.1 HNH endonuclease family protein [Streptomyces sp. PH10-H1]MDJ0370919.1 HNH endonuclease family protein [Streptomyces sp. H10-C2]